MITSSLPLGLSCTLLLAASLAHASGPTRFEPQTLQQDGRITLSPAFAPDGKTLYLAQSECEEIGPCPQRLKVSRKINGLWTTPALVPLPGSDDARVDWPSVSPDGKTLLFSWSQDREKYADLDVREDFDLYRLDLTDPDALPVALDGSDINRPRHGQVRTLRYVHNETAPILTENGDLYFWTERLDGIGERDVYRAASDGQGGFLIAQALPAPINSPQRDDGSWLTPDGRLMLLSYDARGGSGSTDLFVSIRSGEGWTEPVNLGPEVNSTEADFSARLTPDLSTLIFTSTRSFGNREAGLIQTWQMPVERLPVLLDALQQATTNAQFARRPDSLGASMD